AGLGLLRISERTLNMVGGVLSTAPKPLPARHNRGIASGWWQSRRFQERSWRILAFVIILAGASVILIPFVYMVSTALKEHMETYAWPPVWIPRQLMWRNFPDALSMLPFAVFFRNTIVITFTSMVGVVLTSSIAAYGFARLRGRGRDFLFVVLLGTMMLPGQVTLIPVYILFSKIGWINTFYPLIVPAFFGGGAFNIFLLRQFFMTVPLEMDDAAKMDGCSWFGIYWRLILPLSRPALATVAIFHFMGTWNDFFGPLIYLNDVRKYTAAVGLAFFRGSSMGYARLDWLMAMSLLVMLPCLILFFLAQRLFVQGIVITGVKG
ncbi:MAG: carbohydrate ABC transporter permease, partial [Anaerolineae bacterium]